MVPLKASKRRSSTGTIWAVAGVGVLFVGALVGVSLWSSNRQASNAPINLPKEIKSDVDLGAKGMSIGKEGAKSELVEWGDFLCPGCGTTHRILEPEFMRLVESGDLKFTFKDFVLAGHKPYAQWAAEAARCAADQNMYWAYRTTLFTNQKQWTKGDLKNYAKQLGLETASFNQCVDDGTHRAEVEASTAEAERLGLRGTPTFLVNGKEIELEKYGTVDTFMKKLKEDVAAK